MKLLSPAMSVPVVTALVLAACGGGHAAARKAPSITLTFVGHGDGGLIENPGGDDYCHVGGQRVDVSQVLSYQQGGIGTGASVTVYDAKGTVIGTTSVVRTGFRAPGDDGSSTGNPLAVQGTDQSKCYLYGGSISVPSSSFYKVQFGTGQDSRTGTASASDASSGALVVPLG